MSAIRYSLVCAVVLTCLAFVIPPEVWAQARPPRQQIGGNVGAQIGGNFGGNPGMQLGGNAGMQVGGNVGGNIGNIGNVGGNLGGNLGGGAIGNPGGGLVMQYKCGSCFRVLHTGNNPPATIRCSCGQLNRIAGGTGVGDTRPNPPIGGGDNPFGDANVQKQAESAARTATGGMIALGIVGILFGLAIIGGTGFLVFSTSRMADGSNAAGGGSRRRKKGRRDD